jgi:uncharacterized protein involved in tolerance to divalent cations
MPDGNLPIVIMVTAGARDDAERLGEALVVERLAGSCSVVPTIHSFYFTDGLLQREHGALLLVRTEASKRDEVMEYIHEHHSHPGPEILEVRVDQVGNPGLNRQVDT